MASSEIFQRQRQLLQFWNNGAKKIFMAIFLIGSRFQMKKPRLRSSKICFWFLKKAGIKSASELAAFYELLGDAEQQYKWTFVCSIVCKDPLRSYSADYMELKAKGIRGDQIDTARTEAIQIVTNQIAKSSIPSGSVPSLVKSRKSYKAGRLRAVLIGNTSYANFVDLETPIRDIRAIGNLLTEKYQASVRYVENGTRAEIIKELAELSSYAKPNDRVLIYFAGHGELVNKEEEGYWLPTDADADIDTNWISNSYVKRKVRSLAADNVLIVADTCFSGAMTRGISLNECCLTRCHSKIS